MLDHERLEHLITQAQEAAALSPDLLLHTAQHEGMNGVYQLGLKHMAEYLYNNGWIPCSERLPTTEEYQRGNGRFLVTDGNRTYEAEFDIYESHTLGKSRMAIDWFITDKRVTHWQNEPLPPKPYQPKGE